MFQIKSEKIIFSETFQKWATISPPPSCDALPWKGQLLYKCCTSKYLVLLTLIYQALDKSSEKNVIILCSKGVFKGWMIFFCDNIRKQEN